MDTNNFVVYAHYTEDTNELFYIGEGRPKRAYSTANRNKHWKHKINKHGSYVVRILRSNLTKEEAQKIEKELIIFFYDVPSVNLVNICKGSMFESHWLLNVDKTKHPMYGKQRPDSSKRITDWNKSHSGVNSPVYGLKRPDLVERNKKANFKRITKKVRCIETNVVYNSLKEVNELFSKPKSTTLVKHLKGLRKKAFGYTWEYVI